MSLQVLKSRPAFVDEIRGQWKNQKAVGVVVVGSPDLDQSDEHWAVDERDRGGERTSGRIPTESSGGLGHSQDDKATV